MALVAISAGLIPCLGATPDAPRPVVAALNPPIVFTLSVIHADRAAALIRALYPRAIVKVDRAANAMIVVAPPDDIAGMRSVVTGIDIKDPTALTVDAVQVHSANAADIVGRLSTIFPKARFTVAPNRTIVAAATATDLAQIKAIIGG